MDSPHPVTPSVRYQTSDEVDFVIVGAGSAGGVVARELSRAGFRVVVLEQGPYLRASDFTHDEFAVSSLAALTNDWRLSPNTFRATESETAVRKNFVQYGRVVGGGSVHFTGNYWRFHEIDFVERSRKGAVAGVDRDDWPITYAELEPYYDRAEWALGVSGIAGASPFDPPRRRGYPVPPLPMQSTGALAERGARKLGWTAFPAPMAILSKPYKGRSPCAHCGFCETFGCEMGAKSSTLATMIPEAEATGRCEIRAQSYVRQVEVNDAGRVTGVTYFDAHKVEHSQRAKAVVLCANGAETPRLLLMSKSARFPDGLANTSGWVGTHLMCNGGAMAGGAFEHAVNGYRGVVDTRVIHDFYELDPALGIDGGGGLDMRHDFPPISFAMGGLPPDAPTWGVDYKHMLRDWFTRSAYVLTHTTQLPQASNAVSLDPTLKDAWGMPAMRVTFKEHENDLKLYLFMQERAMELLAAAGARTSWKYPVIGGSDPYLPIVHLLGTCRMGDDPRRSVVNRDHRAHDVDNLFIVDGSSFVTSGRGQPTLTIQALAFRAAERMATLARAGELRAGARRS